ncbi:MAG: ArnT family glycosyltransferase [Planctomycetaceae bacterium]
MDYQTDWRRFTGRPMVRDEFYVGSDFFAANGESAFWYFTLVRWACIPFSLLGAWVCYLWGRDLYGATAGLLAAALWCFSPNILAHGAMITPDVGSAALGVLAGYLFWRWLREPSWTWAVLAGIALGLAELTKFTWVVLFVLWPLLWVVYRRTSGAPRAWRLEAGQLGLVALLAVYAINAGYGFEGSFTRLGDFEFVSETLGGPEQDRAGPTGNRFRDSWRAGVPVPVPRNYVSGIDVQKRDFERGKRSYLRGEWKQGGWWYYYVYALLVKVPVGTWVLFTLAGCVSLQSLRSGISADTETPEQPGSSEAAGPRPTSWRDELVLLAPAAVVLVLVSSQTGFNHHLRYVLPAFPFAFVWISKVARHVHWGRKAPGADASGSPNDAGPNARGAPGRWFTVVVCAALLWSVGSSLWVYPHSLSYFNEPAGGPMNGHAHLVDSNIDWGQDLLYLKDWYDEHPEARPFHLAYFGMFNPQFAGFEYRLPPETPHPGWYAVSVNFLKGMQFSTWNGERRRELIGPKRCVYFQHFEPVARAGYSIYIYHVTLDEANRVRRKLGLPLLTAEDAAPHSHQPGEQP